LLQDDTNKPLEGSLVGHAVVAGEDNFQYFDCLALDLIDEKQSLWGFTQAPSPGETEHPIAWRHPLTDCAATPWSPFCPIVLLNDKPCNQWELVLVADSPPLIRCPVASRHDKLSFSFFGWWKTSDDNGTHLPTRVKLDLPVEKIFTIPPPRPAYLSCADETVFGKFKPSLSTLKPADYTIETLVPALIHTCYALQARIAELDRRLSEVEPKTQ
jgi:hypothetical protein